MPTDEAKHNELKGRLVPTRAAGHETHPTALNQGKRGQDHRPRTAVSSMAQAPAMDLTAAARHGSSSDSSHGGRGRRSSSHRTAV